MENITITNFTTTAFNNTLASTDHITQICNQWGAYVLGANGFYVAWWWVFIIAGILRSIFKWNKVYTIETDKKTYFIDFNPFETIQSLAVGVIFIRTFVLYYAVVFGL